VIFPSGGAATTAMLGGHIDVVPITAAFAASMLRQGQVRLLAVAAPSRMPGVLAEVPTWREQGFDAVVSNWRAIIGPKGMPEAQIAYWEESLRRLVESEEWKKELETNFWTTEYLRGAETRKFLERDNAELRAFLVELGLAKYTTGGPDFCRLLHGNREGPRVTAALGVVHAGVQAVEREGRLAQHFARSGFAQPFPTSRLVLAEGPRIEIRARRFRPHRSRRQQAGLHVRVSQVHESSRAIAADRRGRACHAEQGNDGLRRAKRPPA
jgi:hypothetical protein